MKFGPVVQKMSIKDISYLQVWQPLCSVDWNHLYNFRRRHHEEQSSEINFELVISSKISCELKFKNKQACNISGTTIPASKYNNLSAF